MVLWCKARQRATPTSCCTPPKDLISFLFPGRLHVVDFFKHKIRFVPTVGVAPQSSIVIVARNSNVAVTRGLGRGEDEEKNQESPPV